MRLLFGYRKNRETGGVTIDPHAAAIVARVLAAPLGARSACAGDMATSVHTRDSRRRIITQHREMYLRGQARRDLAPDPALAILPADPRWARSEPVAAR